MEAQEISEISERCERGHVWTLESTHWVFEPNLQRWYRRCRICATAQRRARDSVTKPRGTWEEGRRWRNSVGNTMAYARICPTCDGRGVVLEQTE